MKFTGYRENETRARKLVDTVLQGKLTRAIDTRLFLSGEEFKAVQLIEVAATEALIISAAEALVGMKHPGAGYIVSIAPTPLGPQLELVKS